ncbi:AAA family ATPase [Rhodopseudomonas palustris]|uniref:Putative ParA family partition protein n=1 Tax=Rhodopseudomonas palustris (strain BisB18) TaxID=316056 RepID=Q216B2_RHOPB
MHTIVLATQKGGSGKSTLAIGLALAAMQHGHAVRLIETDPQGTLSNWRRRRANAQPVVEALASADDVAQRLATFDRAGVTLTIIDTAGGIHALTEAALACADLCLIPVRPSVADIEATVPTLAAIRGCNRPFAYVLNQTPYRGQRIGHAATTLTDEAALDAAGVLALPYIMMRNDHQDALGAGLAVSEYAPNGKSADEIRGLWQWIEARLGVEAPALTQDILIEFQPSPEITPALYQLDAAADEVVASAD